MKITFFLPLLILTLFVRYLSTVEAVPQRLNKYAGKTALPTFNVWNQNGHDNDASYRSNFNKTHAPWKIQLPFVPGSVDIPLNNGLLYLIPEEGQTCSILSFVNATSGQYYPSSLNICGKQSPQASPVINSNGDFFIVRSVKDKLSLVKVDKSRTNANPITDLPKLQTVYCLAVDDTNNIVVIAGEGGIFGVNGNDGSIVWKNTELTVSSSNSLTLVNELFNTVMTPMVYVVGLEKYTAKINVLSGKLLFNVRDSIFSPYSRIIVGSQFIYTLSSALGGNAWFVYVFDKDNGKFVYDIRLWDLLMTDTFEFCSDITKVNNNLIFYCLGLQRTKTSYLFSLNIKETSKDIVSIKYSAKYNGELSGNIIVLQNNDFVVKSRNEGYIQFSLENGKKNQIVAQSVPSECKAAAANNKMLYFCCKENNAGICQAVVTTSLNN